jgi:hypothetical protein
MIYVLLLHVIIALASVMHSTYAFFRPSITKLHIAYGLVGGTLLSGTLLVVASHAALAQSCLTGLLYLATISVVLVATHYKLAKQ